MKKFFSAVVLFIVSAFAAVAETPATGAAAAPTKVTLGAYVVALYDLNPNNNTFAADLLRGYDQ
ncbi:MAG: hypothetical protein NTU80_08425 [Verrucomicrobia bacterium]|nr:hypothetical protein [Verrucomicrobiota bacterium]